MRAGSGWTASVRRGLGWWLSGVAGMILVSGAPTMVWADATHVTLSQEELSTLVLHLQQEVHALRQTVETQSTTIQHLQTKLDGQPGKDIALLPNPFGQTPTAGPTTRLERYVFGAPGALPTDSGRLPVQAGMGKVNLGLLIQEWYTLDDHAHDSFRHRRLEMGLSGTLAEHLKWKLQIDPSLVREDNTTRSILKDAFAAFDGIPHHLLQLGQYKIPVTEEGFRSSALIDTIERSFIGRTFGDKRDVGLMLSGTWPYLDYQAGVFNGDGENRLDSNDQKDVALRVVLKPFSDVPMLQGFQVGSSFYGRVTNRTASEKKRIGVEARYAHGPFSLKSEYMRVQDAAVPANGWYVQAGYFVLPRWQPVIRFEGFDPNERAAKDKEFDTTIGLNYFLVHPTTKLQLNYVHKEAGENGTTDNQLVGAAQYAF